MAHEVFISYSSKDKAKADSICTTLEAQGLRCWIAPRDILPGMDWGGSIIDAITNSRVMVLLLTSNSNISAQVRREVERAVNKEIIIIPFRTEDVALSKSLEYHLSVAHWMDALTPPLENHLPMLAEKVRQILSNSGEPRYVPFESAPPRRKRPALFIGTGLVIGLIALASLVLWLGQRTSVPEPIRSETVPQASPSPSIAPSPTLASMSPTPAPSLAPRIPTFIGDVSDVKGKKKFIDFLLKNERKVVKIDLTVSLEQEAGITPASPEIFLDLTYKEEFAAGAELNIDLSSGKNDLVYWKQRLQSYLKIIAIETQQGIFSIGAVPVSIENIQ